MRATSLALFVVAATGLARDSAGADLPVAPPPREIRPDGTRDPVPKPDAPTKAEDPAVVVDRIIKNSKDVGDKLAKTDTGTETRKKQDKILADIDALINRQEDPPPPKPEDNKDKDMNKDPMMKPDMPPMNKDPMNKDPMMNPGMPPPKGMDMPMDKMGKGMGMQDDMPMGGMGMNDPMPMSERRPRMNDPMGGDPKKEQGDPKKEPGSSQKTPSGSKDPNGAKSPSGGSAGGKMSPKGSLPFDEDVAKDVWGHLPPKLRQQMTQYYKEDVMPKYAELLRLYYSSLSDKGAPPMPPKK